MYGWNKWVPKCTVAIRNHFAGIRRYISVMSTLKSSYFLKGIIFVKINRGTSLIRVMIMIIRISNCEASESFQKRSKHTFFVTQWIFFTYAISTSDFTSLKYSSWKVCPTCFGTRMPSPWSLQRNTIQHTNVGNDRPYLYHYYIKILEYTKVTNINIQYCYTKRVK